MKGLLAQFPGRRSSWAVIAGLDRARRRFRALRVEDPGHHERRVRPAGRSADRSSPPVRARPVPRAATVRPALIVYRHKGGLTPADQAQIMAEAQAVAGIEKVAQPIAPFPKSPIDREPGLRERRGRAHDRPDRGREDLPRHPDDRRDPRGVTDKRPARGARDRVPGDHRRLQRRDQGRRLQAARGDGRARPPPPDRRLPVADPRARAADRRRASPTRS